ncbi:hypothetical protein J2847_005326 [Azospirillum agricola]|uniref:hypothetical protein n=1 Tax=Azospirillum agricola TaxID=1720247 RepID=UPI002D801BB8|nr:hypothetical protein [Azospirillum agricola]MBP2232001.1 hypothetical protein [Azospirillum agricola]
MSRRSFILCLSAALGALLPGLAANAQTVGAGDRIGNWTVGGLAYTVQTPPENTLSGLNSKVRIGGASLLPQIERYASVRPWIGPGAQSFDGSARASMAGSLAGAGGTTGLMGGVLIDVPLGSFVFTPSFGAGTLPRTPRDGGATTEFRSQLELGYEFDNKSRFSLGYSRIATDGGSADAASAPNNVFGLYYRLPFGGP